MGQDEALSRGSGGASVDTLFFDFIDLAKKLQPKVVVAENVKGLLLGEAKEYVRRIYEGFEDAGYYCQHWLLDAQKMGVPQRRERVFFVCLRKDLAAPFLVMQDLFNEVPKLDLDFNEPPIMFGEVADYSGREINSRVMRLCGITARMVTATKVTRMKGCSAKGRTSIRLMCTRTRYARHLQARNHA